MADPIETVKALDIDAIAREAGASTYTNRHAPGTAFAFGPDTWAAFKAALLSQMQALPERPLMTATLPLLTLPEPDVLGWHPVHGTWHGYTPDAVRALVAERDALVVQACVERLDRVGCDHCADNLRALLENQS